MAYVYRYIRLDKNVPFYIGIGSDDGGKYKRAYRKFDRNSYWHRISNKSEYEVEIILDDLAWDEARLKEIEFISLYGRFKDGGTLANLTKGGDGQLGMTGRPAWNKGKKMSQQMIEKCKAINKDRNKGEGHPFFGKNHTQVAKDKMSEKRKGIKPWNVGKKMNIEWCVRNKENKPKKPVLQYSLSGQFINEYVSCAEAARQNEIRKCGISQACLLLGKTKTYKGFIWKYKESLGLQGTLC